MRNIKLTIEYDGTHLSGWQMQTLDKRTVQSEIELALQIIFKKDIRITGSGRTDAGVHAQGQVANFHTDSTMKTEEIVRALNGNLPEDIVILAAQDVPKKFHAQFSAKRKTYRYTILNRQSRTALQNNFLMHLPYKLDLTLLKKEAKEIIGEKDFRSFMATDHAQKNKLIIKDTIRKVYSLKIRKENDLIHIDITANGFLYKMVRNIIGTLLEVGTGLLPPGSIKKIIKAKSRVAAGMTAPAKGLTLLSVKY
ncbi:MAG: tRNA pseudouridine(38-40) synthase TruA [Candidatus Omnitrophica bacterium]|nr:tRNA pseudouridine(38-40) synthase TruA [Candidatus Omnitrophota bacterium]